VARLPPPSEMLRRADLPSQWKPPLKAPNSNNSARAHVCGMRRHLSLRMADWTELLRIAASGLYMGAAVNQTWHRTSMHNQ
jgi:hypothetical protein